MRVQRVIHGTKQEVLPFDFAHADFAVYFHRKGESLGK